MTFIHWLFLTLAITFTGLSALQTLAIMARIQKHGDIKQPRLNLAALLYFLCGAFWSLYHLTHQ